MRLKYMKTNPNLTICDSGYLHVPNHNNHKILLIALGNL